VLKYVGIPIPRLEDLRLMREQGSFMDDLPVPPNTHYAAVLRSLYAHARIKGINAAKALKLQGVRAVITGNDLRDMIDPMPLAIKSKLKYYPIAIEKVRYVG